MQSSKHNKLFKINQTHILLLLAIICVSGITFFACESSSQRHEVAQAQVQYVALSTHQERKNARTVAQHTSQNMEWEALKIKFEAEFRKNETRITEIKARMKRVSTLERTNRKLKASIESYQQGQVDWDLFKRAFYYDMQALGKELDDLSGHRKK